MPVLGKQCLKRLELPGYPDDDKAFVTIVTNPKAEVWEGMDTTDNMSAMFLILSRVIVEWNFTDETGQVALVTPETVRKALSATDLTLIQEEMGIGGLSS